MLTIRTTGARLCDGVTRREALRIGSLGMLGLSLPELWRNQAVADTVPATRRAKSCILLFLMGAPPQHSTWDPKPHAPQEIRGDVAPIATTVPGIQIGELMPRLAQQADKLCILRAVTTNDNAHSSSGYQMLTGQPHQPLNVENANPGPPNNWPSVAGVVQRLCGTRAGMPAAVRLPGRIFNTDGSVWPGQDAGFLGRSADPWLLRCEPGPTQFRIPDFQLAADVAPARLDTRQALLGTMDPLLASAERGGMLEQYDRQTQQAFGLLRSDRSRHAFELEREAPAMRERYGYSPFGQNVLLARRLVEAGVALVQVNWYRGPDEPSDNPVWDTHVNESARLRTVLVPPMDRAFAALIEDLAQRGMLDETLVVCLAEFGRTPRFNPRGGREHWGHVFSVALAGGGIRGGQVYGASDRIGGHPQEGRVLPADLTATIFHCLGYRPDTEVHDPQGRPFAISRGQVLQQLL
jgi:Protein of unknown function (DUF1501)